MGEVKLSMDADSLKELIEDFTSAMEEMGSIVLKSTGEIPESLDDILRSKGLILFRPGEGIPEGILGAIVEEDQEEVIDFLMEKEEPRERLIQILQEKGYEVNPPEKENNWD